jgi:hypothetical protein
MDVAWSDRPRLDLQNCNARVRAGALARATRRPKPASEVEAAAKALAIPKPALIDANDALGVRTHRADGGCRADRSVTGSPPYRNGPPIQGVVTACNRYV